MTLKDEYKLRFDELKKEGVRIAENRDIQKLDGVYYGLEGKVNTDNGFFSFANIVGADVSFMSNFGEQTYFEAIENKDTTIEQLATIASYGMYLMAAAEPMKKRNTANYENMQRFGNLLVVMAQSAALTRYERKILNVHTADIKELIEGVVNKPYVLPSVQKILTSGLEYIQAKTKV